MTAERTSAIDRRHFLGVVAAGLAAAGCSSSGDGQGGSGDSGDAGKGGTGAGQDIRESPMLHKQVSAGDLPPLSERLPKKPFVVKPGTLVHEEIMKPAPGRYGGTLQLAQESPSGDPIIFVGINEPLIWAPDGFEYGSGVEGNVVEGWEANGDNTRFTFHLRDGLRWSDGKPVTMDDVRFAFDVLFNKEITPVFPTYLQPGGRPTAPPVKFEAVDDLTFTLTFTEPFGTFPAQLGIAGWRGYGDIVKPRHYLEQFHKKYADPKAFKELLDKESIPEKQWFNLFNEKQVTSWMYNLTTELALGQPTLCAWVLQKVDGGVYTYERNPYYFKVDPEGHQLPYMDGIRSQIVQDQETLTSRALFGEFDYLGERATFRKLPVMADKAKQGKIKLLIPRQHVLPTTIFLNLTNTDETWRKVVGDLRVRQALSLALDRKEVIDNFYLGEFARLPTHTNPTDHDLGEANRLLDEAGLDDKDGDGYRLGPDGKRFRIPFEVADLSENHVPLAELVAEYWKKVGLYTTVHKIDDTLFGQRQEDNTLKATIIWIHYPIWQYAAMDDYLPYNSWAPLWYQWNVSEGKEGEEPPEEIKQLIDNDGKYKAARLGTPESKAAYDAIVKSHHDNIWALQVVEHAYWPTFFSNRVKNVPTGTKKEEFGIIVSYSMEQWYLDG